jgi:DNA-binding GntR family transcriptional regulator
MPNSTLAENVAHALRHAIFAGEYLSGERLLELALAHDLHVSQNTVRDALRILEHDGLVVKRPRQGVRVRAFTADEASEVYTLWAAVEGIALEQASGRLDAGTLAHLRALLAEARLNSAAGAARLFSDAVFAVHQAVAQAGGPLTGALLITLHNQGRLLEITRQMRAPRDLRQQDARLEGCAALLEALAAGDAAAARAVFIAALEADRAALLAVLD